MHHVLWWEAGELQSGHTKHEIQKKNKISHLKIETKFSSFVSFLSTFQREAIIPVGVSLWLPVKCLGANVVSSLAFLRDKERS